MTTKAFHHRIAELPRRNVGGVMDHTAFLTDNAVLHFSWLDKGHPIIPDQHDWDQTMIAVSGTFDLTIDDEHFHVSPGDLCYVPSNARHWVEVTSEEPAHVLQVFAPIRADYRELAESLLGHLR